MNPGLNDLQPYPFERLARLLRETPAPSRLPRINLSIGEPQHPTPKFIGERLSASLEGLGKYPATRGGDPLRDTIAAWLTRRFGLGPGSVDPDRHVLPVNGTREALFSIAQCVIDRSTRRPIVLMPNPFYQIYEGAALLAGAQPHFVDCPAETGFAPAFDTVADEIWADCQLVYVCSPGNPAGNVLPREAYRSLLELADEFDFTIVADECYSEIYLDEAAPPVGLLQVAAEIGRVDFNRCIVMHSLSKRSSAPGLRSGFAAGDADILASYFRYRTYHGCAMPLHVQQASIAAWSDEAHVVSNRRLYREKFAAVVPILAAHLEVECPPAGFYLWPRLPDDDIEFCRTLIARANVVVLPGQFLGRETARGNPGTRRVRIALVPEMAQCIEAAERLNSIFVN